MKKLFNELTLLPEEALEEAEGISSTFKRVSILTDDIGFMNSLGSLLTMKVRGSVVLFVYDIHDIRPLCSILKIPCLEPWDSESLMNALIEGKDYSEAFEIPYIVRIGLWLRDVKIDGQGMEIMPRGATFNKNWGEPLRWGLDRLINVSVQLPAEVINRARNFIYELGAGERVLISGSAWSLIKDRIDELKGKYTLVRSLYIYPLSAIEGIKYTVDVGNYLSNTLRTERLLSEEIDRRYEELLHSAINELFFRGAGDPLMLIEWLIYKSRAEGEVPIVVLDVGYSTVASEEGMGISYDLMPTFYEIKQYNQVVDIIGNSLPIALGIKASGYDHGRIIAITNPCSLMKFRSLRDLVSNGVLVLAVMLNNECPEVLSKLSDVGIKYEVVNYNANEPLVAFNDLMRLLNHGGLVIIRALLNGNYRFNILDEYCDNCGDCLRIGCPAITMDKHPVINPRACVGCGICQVVCERGAITRVKLG